MFNVSKESCGGLAHPTGSAQSSKIKKLPPGTGPYKYINNVTNKLAKICKQQIYNFAIVS